MELKCSLEWEDLKRKLLCEFAVYYDANNTLKYDQEIAKIVIGFDTYIPEISIAEVVNRTAPKYHKLQELLQKFNEQLQDCKELFLIRVMTR